MRRIKHLWMTLLTVILAVSLIVGGAGLSALAATNPISIISPASIALPTSVNLGEDIKLGRSNLVTVLAPNGANVTNDIVGSGSAAAITTKMVGNYTIKYTDNATPNATYEHKVNVKLDGTFEFRVEHDGAKLPTYVNPETEVTLPKAELYELNEDTNVYEPTTKAYSYDVYINNIPATDAQKKGEEKVRFAAGTNSVQYFCTYNNTTKNFIKEYTVKSQKDFIDKTAPKLSVSGIPETASINTKVTLPKATATDDYDENVFVEVSVKFNGEPVLQVELDEKYNTYAVKYKDGNLPVEFDNVYNLSFYPMEEGDYTIEYQAFDDADKDGVSRKSVKHPSRLTVSDRTAPKLEKIADDQIPAKWGKDILDKDGAASNIITFPMPEYSDNALETGNVKVSFEIRDTVNNNLVIKFDNIYSYSENNGVIEYSDETKYVYSSETPLKGLYEANAEFKKEGFDFDFSKYKIDNVTPLGKYTATYQASDSRPNITSKSYDITLEDVFKDEVEPTVILEADEYLYVSNELTEYTLSAAKISDTLDANPTINYFVKATTFIKKDNVVVADGIKVENGATIEISNTKIKYDKVEYTYEGDLNLEVTAIDDVKNSKKETRPLTIITDAEVATHITLGINDSSLNNGNSFTAGELASLGDLLINTIGTDDNYRKYSGFELTLQNPDGDIINGVSLETYYTAKNINVKDIKFTPSVEGIYTLTVRAFDVSGRSLVKAYKIDVDPNVTGGTDIHSATAVGTTGSVQTSYKLNNETIRNASDVTSGREYVVRRISNAGKFSLMGIEFTGYSTGAYNFEDGYYQDVTDGSSTVSRFKRQEAYTLTVSDTASPVFHILDRMPTHIDKSSNMFTLPGVVAFNDYANAEIEVNVASPSRTLTLGIQLIENTDANGVTTYSFRPDEDGEYTITYTASINNSAEVKQTYKIKVGDVIAPSFKLIGTHASTATLESTFEFKALEYDTAINADDIKDVTFTKKLIDPSGEVVYTTSAKNETGRDKIHDSTDEAYTFTMTGTYTVEYTATDKVGNYSIVKETIVVSVTGRATPAPLKILRNVLIIVGIILLGGVIIYFVRYYNKGGVKVKSTKKR